MESKSSSTTSSTTSSTQPLYLQPTKNVKFCYNTQNEPSLEEGDMSIKFCFGSNFLSNEMNAQYANEKWELAFLPTGDMTMLPETIRNNMNKFFPSFAHESDSDDSDNGESDESDGDGDSNGNGNNNGNDEKKNSTKSNS